MSLAMVMTEPARIPAAALLANHRCGACPVRALSICSAMPTADLGRLAAIKLTQQVEPGEGFIDESEPATHLINITQGAVKVYKLLPDGRRQVTGFLFAGDLLGLAFNGAYVYSA
jgi:CRP/FNR family transcriptional regulator, anaerobic regulatory protein